MVKKYRLLGLGVVLVAVCLVRLVQDLPTGRAVLAGLIHGETFYHGKPLSYWVQRTKFRIEYGPATIRTDPDESDGTRERDGAWQALVEMGRPGAQGIAFLLKDDNEVIRYQAAMALRQMRSGAREVLPDLMDAVRRDLTLARAQEHPAPGTEPRRDQNPAFTGMTVLREIESVYQIDRSQMPFVINALLETMAFVDDPEVRLEAWADLRSMDPRVEIGLDDNALPLPAADMADEMQALQQLRVAETQLRSAEPDAMAAGMQTTVEALVRTTDDWIRTRAWYNMQRFDPAAKLGNGVSLAALAADPKDGPRLVAKARALQRLRETEAAYALTRKRGDAVLAFMETLVRTQDDWVRGTAWNDLKVIDPDAEVSPAVLVQALRKQPGAGPALAIKVTRYNAMRQTEALLRVRIASTEKISDLLDVLLHGNDSWMQNMAWRYLQAVDPRAQTIGPALTKALDDQSPDVRKVAARALEKIQSDHASATR